MTIWTMDIDISRIRRKTIAIHLKIESYHKMQTANFKKYLNMSRDGIVFVMSISS